MATGNQQNASWPCISCGSCYYIRC